MDNLFGGTVAIDSDVIVVRDSTAFDSSGAASVFRFDGAQWRLETVLAMPELGDRNFASSLAIQGDLLVLGSYHEDGRAPRSGAVHVYQYDTDSGEWRHTARLLASDGATSDLFGWSVSIDGSAILVGAVSDDIPGGIDAGSAYVFRKDGDFWREEAQLTDPDGALGDAFGGSVALRGDVAVVAAPNKHHSDVGQGSVFVFNHSGGTWVLNQELVAFDSIGNQELGHSISLVNDVLLVGAPLDNNGAGAAYIFRYADGTWMGEARLTAVDGVGPYRFFGISASLDADGKVAIIGASDDFALGFEAGAAYVFRFDGAEWSEMAKLLASDGMAEDYFGISVGVTDDLAVIGGPGLSSGPGTAYVFAGVSGRDCNANAVSDACEIFEGTAQDANGDGVPDECSAVGDINGDRVVNVVDLLAMLATWGACASPCPPACLGDVDEDCAVSTFDLLTLLTHWD